ncbi:MAG: 23S rRNA pseudouridine(955/2504/2580) synthase RluC [Gammaproteobacteria bacterium]|nr:MAG: 23S rRNA pseudouridine(955/2504/2580) synthase RluC [Gammaproteobacteria bacterium]
MSDSPSADSRAPSAVRLVTIDEDRAGQRLDNFLMAELNGVPKSRIYRMLRTGEVRVSGRRAKASDRLQAGDKVRIPPVREAARAEKPVLPDALKEAIRSRILLEQPGYLVVNKPAGLAVHGGSGVSFGLIEVLRQLFPGEALELAHRLDRDTSGCILVARSRKALLSLHRQLREQEMDKAYWALVKGKWPAHCRTVTAPLEKNQLQSGERMVRVSQSGKESATEFRVLRRFAVATLVEAKPLTGRTHQIRVHGRHAGHPLAGDPKYGDDDFNKQMKEQGLKRLFLHAASLSFADPQTGKAVTVSAPLDPELDAVLEQLDD